MTQQADFIDCVDLWTTIAPYSKFPSQTINWRLAPAIESGQYKIWHNEGGSCAGFVTWAWMTNEEFETRDYCGINIFQRKIGDKLVVVDMITSKGTSSVLNFSRDIRKMFFSKFPEVKKVWSHRGPRSGVYPNKGG
tara:strand:- start:810 stop:1217 length:408 start_codon:yes stop_codon:yes gene_type:complete